MARHGKGVEGVAFPEPHYEMQEEEPEELHEQVILNDVHISQDYIMYTTCIL